MEQFLAYLDQFRYMAGTLGMLFLLCHRTLPHREKEGLRIACSSLVCLLLAFLYVPLQNVLAPYLDRYPFLIGPYWVLMAAVPVLHVRACYEVNFSGALVFSMIASFTENIITALVRNLFVYTLFPDFPSRHPLLYIAFMILAYTFFFLAANAVLVPNLQQGIYAGLREDTATRWVYLFLYIAYFLMMFAIKHLMENLLPPLRQYTELTLTYRYVQLFCVLLLILLSVVMTAVMWYITAHVALASENEVIRRLSRERQTQYEISRENIEMINQKSHDLKHQLQALALVSDEERNRQIQETSRAIDFYDATVKTGNEALDTLLTEKSVYCTNRSIRLSCMVSTENLRKIALIDLYTLLGNAIDNAIESVERIENPEQKVISLSILDRSNILYIQLENYFSGTLTMQGDLPQTQKKDTFSHGYGVKSIRNIVRRYGGTMGIRTEGQVFCLEIVIPT
ncbi:MAG: sensor histidine kinase [Clostridia bacterium]|nr:sensor histidine kinase [Clostridia bacterium]MBR1683948.1 sensor histidine kinase [Clostridia bacterium]MBR2286647.1 sensor histidine kinase [Clostridia bacterium]